MRDDISTFTKELRNLLDKYGVGLGVDIDGDTHGISTNFVVLDMSGNTLETLNHYSESVYSYEIE